MSICRICLEQTSDLGSLYDREGSKYLPAVVYNISGVKIVRRMELNAKICFECKEAVLIAESIILRCQESEQFIQSLNHDDEEAEGFIDPESEPKPEILQCDICEFNTHTVRGLVAHRKEVHQIDDNKIFPCQMCEKRFPWKSALNRHIQNDHKTLPADKKFLCIECGNIYILQRHLLEHQLQSHGPRRFRCVEPDCKQTFTRAFTLRRHFLTTHQNKSERYHCSDCNEYFKVYDHWKYHNKIVHKNQKRDFKKYKSSKRSKNKTTA